MVDVRLQTELVVETEDRVGVVAEISRLLADMGINLLSIMVRTEEDRALVHLVTTSQTHAHEALRKACFEVREREVVLVELPHHPGFLSKVSEALARKGLAVDELYATVPESGSIGVVVLLCPDIRGAVQLLRGR